MSAFSAAAQNEDGDIIKTLQARVADLEAQLYAVGAGGVGSTVARQDHHEQHLNMVPEGWKLVPVEPTEAMLHAGNSAIENWGVDANGSSTYRAMLAAAPQPPAVEQPQVEQDVDWPEVARLLRTVKYLIGIVERGSGRKMRDDETVEQFVLGYVQSLEQPQGGQEPVAYYVMNGAALFQLFRSKSQAGALAYDLQKRHDLSGSPAHFHVVPLYTHPQPKRQPLTGEQQIAETLRLQGLALVKTANGYDVLKLGQITAHKIGGEA